VEATAAAPARRKSGSWCLWGSLDGGTLSSALALVEPTSFQFWQARPGRMHDRFRYAPIPDGGWSITRLQP